MNRRLRGFIDFSQFLCYPFSSSNAISVFLDEVPVRNLFILLSLCLVITSAAAAAAESLPWDHIWVTASVTQEKYGEEVLLPPLPPAVPGTTMHRERWAGSSPFVIAINENDDRMTLRLYVNDERVITGREVVASVSRLHIVPMDLVQDPTTGTRWRRVNVPASFSKARVDETYSYDKAEGVVRQREQYHWGDEDVRTFIPIESSRKNNEYLGYAEEMGAKGAPWFEDQKKGWRLYILEPELYMFSPAASSK